MACPIAVGNDDDSQARVLRPKKKKPRPGTRGKAIVRLLENDLIKRVSYEQYREKVRDVYAGPQGALLATASLLSLHIHLGDRMLRERKFDLRGAKAILDVGSGAGQIAKHLLKYADPGASITCCDLSPEMLRRARARLKSAVPSHVAADLSRLPFADESFDCVTCGYVLEHLPEAGPGLSELARVMRPGGRMLLLTTEDNFSAPGRAASGVAAPTTAKSSTAPATSWAWCGRKSFGSPGCTSSCGPAASASKSKSGKARRGNSWTDHAIPSCSMPLLACPEVRESRVFATQLPVAPRC